jgi:DNA-binding beta-propeller fold protein YncE
LRTIISVIFAALLLAATHLHAASSFERDMTWPGALPEGWKYKMVSNISGDSKGRIYVAHRGEHPVLVFDKDGKFLRSIGDDVIEQSMMYDVMKDPPTPISRQYWIHGIHVDPSDNIWVTDYGRQVIFKFSQEGKMLMMLGTLNKSGADEQTFYQPAGVAVSKSGHIYVADGYGNSRVVKFSPEGKFIKAWGKKGSGPGEFNLPHAIAVGADDRIYVTERLNSRVQIFDADGNYLTQWNLGRCNAIAMRPDGKTAFVGSATYRLPFASV